MRTSACACLAFSSCEPEDDRTLLARAPGNSVRRACRALRTGHRTAVGYSRRRRDALRLTWAGVPVLGVYEVGDLLDPIEVGLGPGSSPRPCAADGWPPTPQP